MLGPRLLATEKPIGSLAADGASVAYIADSTETDCEHVSVWTPSRARIQRVSYRLPAVHRVTTTTPTTSDVYELALAGSMVGWSTNLGCGNSGCGVDVHSARLPDANSGRDRLRRRHGLRQRVPAAIRPGRPWPRLRGRVRTCALRAPDGNGAEVPAAGRRGRGRRRRRPPRASRRGQELIVDDHLPGRGPGGTRRQAAAGRALDGRGWSRPEGLAEVYDTNGGGLLEQRPLQPGTVLDGSAGGVVVLRHGAVVTALRLDDGREVTFTRACGPVRAAIGGAGLYYSYPHFRARRASRARAAQGARAAAREREVVPAAVPCSAKTFKTGLRRRPLWPRATSTGTVGPTWSPGTRVDARSPC